MMLTLIAKLIFYMLQAMECKVCSEKLECRHSKCCPKNLWPFFNFSKPNIKLPTILIHSQIQNYLKFFTIHAFTWWLSLLSFFESRPILHIWKALFYALIFEQINWLLHTLSLFSIDDDLAEIRQCIRLAVLAAYIGNTIGICTCLWEK